MQELTIEKYMPREKVERVFKALSVESGREVHRTKVKIEGGESLKITIKAEDLHALRAALNSYLRWLQLAVDVEEVIEDGS